MAPRSPDLTLKLAIVASRQTQRALSRQAQMSENRLSEIVLGVRKANAKERTAIAKALKTKADVLFPEADHAI